MEENVQKILGMINTDIGGVNFQVEGQLVRFHFDKKSNVYTIYSGGKLQTISLNELLTVLNSPLMKQPMADKIQEMEEEKARIEEMKQQYLDEVTALDASEEEKEQLRKLVVRIMVPGEQMGFANRVYVIDPELEARREDYFAHRKEYEEKRRKLMEEAEKLEMSLQTAAPEKEEGIREQVHAKWTEASEVPSAPDILNQHIRLNKEAGIQLVTTLDGNALYHNYKLMTIPEVADFVKGKELKFSDEREKDGTEKE